MSLIRKIYDLLSPRERRNALFLLFMIIIMAVLEILGVASIMPFLAVAGNPEVIHKNIFLARVFEILGFDDPQTFLLVLGGAFLLLFLVSIGFRALTDYFTLRFIHNRNYAIGRRLLQGYLAQPYEFFLGRNTADLGKNILAEVNQVISQGMKPLMNLLAHSLVSLVLIGLVLAVDPAPALVFGVIIGGSYLTVYLVVRNRLARLGKERLLANRGRYTAASEVLGGIKDVKLLGREKNYLSRFAGPALRFARTSASADITKMMPRFVMEALAFGGIVSVALYFIAVKETFAQTLPVLGIYALAGYRLMPALQNIFQSLVSIRFSLPAIDSLHREYMQKGLSTEAKTREEERLIPKDKIVLDQITYYYPGSTRPALSGLDLEIPVGRTLGVVGSTGAGKTTLVDVILGLLRPQEGRIVVDETEITAQNLRLWQNTLGYVPQHVYLSDDTVAANIAFGLPGEKVDQDRVIQVAKAARLHDFIQNELPQGYQTVVGERGVRLSGGQRQRMSIARALYQRPEVLVLDEATSALDNLTEREVMEAIHRLKGKMTIVIIAHRLSTVKACDRIVLLDNGRVEGLGTYEELFVNNDHFRAMAGGQA